MQHGMTLRELAHALGYPVHTHITLVENGKRQPTLDLVMRVAQFFGVSTDQLLNDALELDLPEST
jgi:transcriptional regulator with XRE-family HTH domain